MDAAEVVAVESILEDFASLSDPRSSVNRVHSLEDIIVIAILAVIAGSDGPKAIGVWAASHERWLRNELRLSGCIPSHDTVGRVLMALKPEAFQSWFQGWIRRITQAGDNDGVDVIAIDGKALRRITTSRPVSDHCSWLARGQSDVASAWGNWQRKKNRTKSRRFLNCWTKSTFPVPP